jgi:hypothetical protein
LFAAAILRRNPDSVVIPFDDTAYEAKVDPQDTILSLAERLARYGGGGTDCACTLPDPSAAHPASGKAAVATMNRLGEDRRQSPSRLVRVVPFLSLPQGPGTVPFWRKLFFGRSVVPAQQG